MFSDGKADLGCDSVKNVAPRVKTMASEDAWAGPRRQNLENHHENDRLPVAMNGKGNFGNGLTVYSEKLYPERRDQNKQRHDKWSNETNSPRPRQETRQVMRHQEIVKKGKSRRPDHARQIANGNRVKRPRTEQDDWYEGRVIRKPDGKDYEVIQEQLPIFDSPNLAELYAGKPPAFVGMSEPLLKLYVPYGPPMSEIFAIFLAAANRQR
jgi:hypothetical protein